MYSGEANPTAFTAWKESIYATIPLYDVPPRPSQVQVAIWFLSGKAKDWWQGVFAAKEYGEIQISDIFFDVMELQFQLHDAPEQYMRKWVILKQSESVNNYMNMVNQLYNTWRLCQKAEFGLVILDFKDELKGMIRHVLLEQKSKWTLLCEVCNLVMSTEVERGGPL